MESELQRRCASVLIECIEEKLIEPARLQSAVLPLTFHMMVCYFSRCSALLVWCRPPIMSRDSRYERQQQDQEGDIDTDETARQWLPVLSASFPQLKPNAIQVPSCLPAFPLQPRFCNSLFVINE
jgi:hypothetical protein